MSFELILPFLRPIETLLLAYHGLSSGSVATAREKGLYRMEGKEYVVQDGDVMLFKFNA